MDDPRGAQEAQSPVPNTRQHSEGRGSQASTGPLAGEEPRTQRLLQRYNGWPEVPDQMGAERPLIALVPRPPDQPCRHAASYGLWPWAQSQTKAEASPRGQAPGATGRAAGETAAPGTSSTRSLHTPGLSQVLALQGLVGSWGVHGGSGRGTSNTKRGLSLKPARSALTRVGGRRRSPPPVPVFRARRFLGGRFTDLPLRRSHPSMTRGVLGLPGSSIEPHRRDPLALADCEKSEI